MASVHPRAAAGRRARRDPVIAALGALGAPVDCTGLRSLLAGGPAGAVAGRGRRPRPVRRGRRAAGALALPRPARSREPCCSARSRARSTPWSAGPLQDCALRRDPAARAVPARVRRPRRPVRAVSTAATTTPGDAALEPAGARLRARHRPQPAGPLRGPAGRPDRRRRARWPTTTSCGCRWRPGSVQYGAAYSAEAAGDLLVDGAMWQRMVNQQYRLLSALDRWIEQLERAHEDRTAAGIKAGETVREQADQALLASIGRSGQGVRAARPAAPDDATYAACRLVAEAAGITLTEPADGRRGERPDRPGRADRGRLPRPHPRGPARRALVAGERRPAGGPPRRVRRAGRAAVAARPLRGGEPGDRAAQPRRTRATPDEFETARRDVLPAAARTAVDARGGCCASACAAPGRDLRNLVLSGLVTVGARRAGADRDRAGCSACTCRTPRRASSSRSRWRS